MISRVLVPMDDSEMAEHALEYALKAHPDAEITVLHIVGEPSPMMGKAMGLALEDDLEEAADEHASQVLERAREIAQTHEREIKTDVAWGVQRKRLSIEQPNSRPLWLGATVDRLRND